MVAATGWYRYEFDVPAAFSGFDTYLIMAGTSAYGNDVNIDDVGVTAVSASAPTVTAATSATADGNYKAGAAINVTVTFSEQVSSPAGLTIYLNSGGAVTIGAFGGIGGVSLTYTVAGGETTADLSISSITGTIVNADARATVNPSIPPGRNIADAKAIVVDTTAPTGSVLINNGATGVNTTAVTLNLSATDTGGSGIASMRFRNTTTGALRRLGTLPDHQGLDPGRRGRDQEGLRPVHGRGGESLGRQPGYRGWRAAIPRTRSSHDVTPPTGSILINNGAASTGTDGGDPESHGRPTAGAAGWRRCVSQRHGGALRRVGALQGDQGLGR